MWAQTESDALNQAWTDYVYCKGTVASYDSAHNSWFINESALSNPVSVSVFENSLAQLKLEYAQLQNDDDANSVTTYKYSLTSLGQEIASCDFIVNNIIPSLVDK